MLKYASLTTAAVVLSVSGAHAADFGNLKDTPFAVATINWTGVYGGVTAGYGAGSSSAYLCRGTNHPWTSNDPSGAVGGGTLGYNYQLNPQWVLGVEGDLSAGDMGGTNMLNIWDGHHWATGWDGLLTVRGRVGYSLGKTLLYGTAGFAALHSDETIAGNTPGEAADGRGWRPGFAVGAGVEQKFTDRISGKIEYLYMDFADLQNTDMNGEAMTWRADMNLIRVGMNYKLN